MESIEIRQIM